MKFTFNVRKLILILFGTQLEEGGHATTSLDEK
jgi:hypothetical protein